MTALAVPGRTVDDSPGRKPGRQMIQLGARPLQRQPSHELRGDGVGPIRADGAPREHPRHRPYVIHVL